MFVHGKQTDRSKYLMLLYLQVKFVFMVIMYLFGKCIVICVLINSTNRHTFLKTGISKHFYYLVNVICLSKVQCMHIR